MLRLALKLSLAAAATWAVWTFVPVDGRTLAQRWKAAGGLAPFVERGWAEATGARERPAPKPQARQKPASRERPSEAHSEADRRALDRLLAEHLEDARP
jgi:hypothetical protein